MVLSNLHQARCPPAPGSPVVSGPDSPYLERKLPLGVASAHVSSSFPSTLGLGHPPHTAIFVLFLELAKCLPVGRGACAPAVPSARDAPPPGTDLIHTCSQMSQRPCLPTPATVSPLVQLLFLMALVLSHCLSFYIISSLPYCGVSVHVATSISVVSVT